MQILLFEVLFLSVEESYFECTVEVPLNHAVPLGHFVVVALFHDDQLTFELIDLELGLFGLERFTLLFRKLFLQLLYLLFEGHELNVQIPLFILNSPEF